MNYSQSGFKTKYEGKTQSIFKENLIPRVPRSQSIHSQDDRLSHQDLQVLQLQRQIEDLKKDQKDLDQLKFQVQQKEQEIRKLEEQKEDEEKQFKIVREKTLSELASLKTKVSTQKKRLQELDICYQANLVDFEQINKLYLEKEAEFKDSSERLVEMNQTIKELTKRTNNAGKRKVQLEEEKANLVNKIGELDKVLDEKLLEFKSLKDQTKKQENVF